MTEKSPRRLFYGWKMVWASFGLQVMSSSMLQQSLGAYVAVLREEFGWSKTELAAAASMQQLENGMLGPLQGWFVDRFGPRLSMRLGVAAFGIGFLLFSRVQTPLAFYVAFVVMALGASMMGYLTLTYTVVQWFERRRSTALEAGFSASAFSISAASRSTPPRPMSRCVPRSSEA